MNDIRASLTPEQERWVAANTERVTLREQAWAGHKSNLETEERRYQAELAHIDDVYKLRTEAPEQETRNA